MPSFPYDHHQLVTTVISVQASSPSTVSMHNFDWLPPGSQDAFLSGGVIAVVVLGLLCLLLGTIYGYIYFTRINPRSNRIARKYIEQPDPVDSELPQGASTHLFLFKKS